LDLIDRTIVVLVLISLLSPAQGQDNTLDCSGESYPFITLKEYFSAYGVIFPKEASEAFPSKYQISKYTPIEKDIILAEEALAHNLDNLKNDERILDFEEFKSKIDKKRMKSFRRYFGLIDRRGDEYVMIELWSKKEKKKYEDCWDKKSFLSVSGYETFLVHIESQEIYLGFGSAISN